jgi:hypothetical protein
MTTARNSFMNNPIDETPELVYDTNNHYYTLVFPDGKVREVNEGEVISHGQDLWTIGQSIIMSVVFLGSCTTNVFASLVARRLSLLNKIETAIRKHME